MNIFRSNWGLAFSFMGFGRSGGEVDRRRSGFSRGGLECLGSFCVFLIYCAIFRKRLVGLFSRVSGFAVIAAVGGVSVVCF